ncbi:MAG: hypothetical protein Q8K45_17925 [Rubrivivax sp.]|nr:hypothetical protein [Rubrivivax sp.]
MNARAAPLPAAPPDTVADSLQALLALVDGERERQQAQILDGARSRAAALRLQARAEARARLRQAFGEQRLALQAHVAAAQARLATQQRLHTQQRLSTLLTLAWQQLPAALAARWALPAARAAWVARVLAMAHARLPAAGWRLVHAPGWPADEREAAAARLAATGHADARFEADAGLVAGLKVVAQGNVIDGSLPGLLADRSEVEAALLRRLETTEDSP